MSTLNPSGASQSRTNSTYADAAVRPRAKRFISGFEEFPPPPNNASNSTTTAAIASPPSSNPLAFDTSYFSRAPSPIPAKHPSRASSLKPSPNRNKQHLTTGNGDLATSLSGLWGRSWTSLQELASNVLGNEEGTDSVKDNSNIRSRRTTPVTSRPGTSHRQWGPTPQPQLQPGQGSTKERGAIVRAKKREEMLSGTDAYSGRNVSASIKRRTSDDFSSSSAPAAESDDRDVLVYIHHVVPTDTMAGISIRYTCQIPLIKKINRLWSNDGIQARKTLLIPVDACTVRGRRVSGPIEQETDLLISDDNSAEDAKNDAADYSYQDRRASTATVRRVNGSGGSPPASIKPAEDHVWTHESWIMLDGQTAPIEIGRLPRSNLGYFPKPRRKSGSISERSSLSIEVPRPSITISDTSSVGHASMHRPRRSSGSNQFASQMLGPGGVGSLKGKGPSTLGPSEDKITKAIRKGISGIVTPSASPSDDENSIASGPSTPGIDNLGYTIESWAKKFSTGISKAFDNTQARQQRRVAGVGTTTSGDLIELATSFEIGEEENEEDLVTPTNGPTNGFMDRGRSKYIDGEYANNHWDGARTSARSPNQIRQKKGT